MKFTKISLVFESAVSSLKKPLLPFLTFWVGYEQANPQRAASIKKWGKRGAYFLLAYFIFWLIFLKSIPTVSVLRDLESRNATEIYSDDQILMGRYFVQARTSIPADSIPGFVFHALVAIEDKRFFSHRGVDLRSWGRVLVRTIIGGDDSGGGGSTLSQQLAKNLFPREKYLFLSLLRSKVKEIIIARKLERVYSKMELLTLYLNTVPFSENVYGIEVASKRFFSKSPMNLTLSEAAALMGTLKANTLYNPRKATEKVRIRRNLVLRQMLENSHITHEITRLSPIHKKNIGALDRDLLPGLLESPLLIDYNPIIKNEGIAPYFQIYVKKELDAILSKLKKENGTAYNIDIDGLKVYTTLDTRLQRLAEEAVTEHLSYLQKNYTSQWKNQAIAGEEEAIELMKRQSLRYQQLRLKGASEKAIEKDFNTPVSMVLFQYDGEAEPVFMTPMDSLRYYFRILQVGFVALEPAKGHIKSWIGGVDFTHFKYDHVKSRRQTGSVFKPLVYTAALLNGRDPCEQIPNQLQMYHEYKKHEWDKKQYGRVDPEPHILPNGKDEDDWLPQNADGKYGGSYSMEGALTHSINTITVALVFEVGVQAVIRLARKLGIFSSIPNEPSIGLGAAEISLLEMVSAFSVYPNAGFRYPPKGIRKITDAKGRVIYEIPAPKGNLVLPPDTALIMLKMLQSVATFGTASRLRWQYGLGNKPIAGKTGTSQFHADGWFIGFNPKLIAGAWVGGDSRLIRFRNFEWGQGAATALPVWGKFMQKLYQDSSLSVYNTGSFPELDAARSANLNCPLRIKSAEELYADSLAQDSILKLELLKLDSLNLNTPTNEEIINERLSFAKQPNLVYRKK
jgi:penicillin-binding protein 1A